MVSGLSSRKEKAAAMKKKYIPTTYNYSMILQWDLDVHISKFAFIREVLTIFLNHAHAYECNMMMNDVCDECDKCGRCRSECVSSVS